MAIRNPLPLTSNDTVCCAPVTEQALSSQDAADIAPVFAALGDPVRLQLFSLIAASEESCSCDLEGPVQRSQPTVSHHTKILADAGLIMGDKRGRWVWWRVNPVRLAAVRRVLGEVPTP